MLFGRRADCAAVEGLIAAAASYAGDAAQIVELGRRASALVTAAGSSGS